MVAIVTFPPLTIKSVLECIESSVESIFIVPLFISINLTALSPFALVTVEAIEPPVLPLFV